MPLFLYKLIFLRLKFIFSEIFHLSYPGQKCKKNHKTGHGIFLIFFINQFIYK